MQSVGGTALRNEDPQMQTSVLLVDDDRQQASKLHHVIQSERPHWTVHVQPFGSDPLRFMAEHQVDVVIDGRKSPNVLSCPEQLETQFPNCVCLTADDTTNQPQTLVDRIEQCCGLRSRLHDRELQAITMEIDHPQSLTEQASTRLSESPISGFSLDAYFEHARSVGQLAKTIAWLLNEPTGSEAASLSEHVLVTGTLHDIGKLVLGVYRPHEFSEALSLSEATGKPLWQSEMAVLGTTHAAIGAHLLCTWGYPAAIIEAVALHHQPSLSSNPNCPNLIAVHVANAVQHAGEPASRCELRMDRLANGDLAPIWDDDFLDTLGLLDRAQKWATQFQNARKRSFANP